MVDTLHPLYTKNTEIWKFLRDSVEGSIAIKDGGYVPMLDGQDKTAYTAMVNRPSYENYTQRTLDGLTGLIFSKQPTKTAPKPLEDLFDNIDAQGKPLLDLAQETVEEVETVGRVGLLVDAPNADVTGMTEAEAEALNLRPFVKMYSTENIINWKHETINNEQVLSMVVLKESKDVWEDMFTNKPQTFYRVLHLVDNIYTQTIYEEVKQGSKVTYAQSGEQYQPRMKGNTLTYIPFVSITPTSLEINPAKSPLFDLADVNLTHFKTNVDYYHGMHFTALPTPYGSGVQMGTDETIKVGSTSFHMFPDPSAKLEYLEFQGDGLGTLEREKEKLKESMVILGANMLQGDKKTAEAENTVAMRSSGERATLISIADTCSRGITKALEIMAEWLGASGEVSYKLNRDYNLTEMDAQRILALNTVQMSGNLTKEDLFNAYKEGEIIKEDKTFDEHQTQLDEETPDLSVSPIKSVNKTEDKSTLSSIKSMIGLGE